MERKITAKYSVTERVNRHRERMRKAGLTKIEIWVPDTANPKFVKEARRQSRLAAKDAENRKLLKAFQEITAWD